MKKLLLGSVALVALGAGAPAIAADMGVPRAVAYVGGTNWTGCHIGGSVGDMWGRNSGYAANGSTAFVAPGAIPPFPIPAGAALTNEFNMSGFIGGGYAGCDYQFGAWVVGVEGDWSNVNKEGQNSISPAAVPLGVPIFGPGGFNTLRTFNSAERWVATARARLGYAVDRWMLYVTGGAAWMKIDSAEWNLGFPEQVFNSQSDRRTGWTVGAGLEYGLSYGWSVRSEYLYVRIPTYTTFTGPLTNAGIIPACGAPCGNFVNVDSGPIQNHIFRFGLTYKFGNYYAAAVTK